MTETPVVTRPVRLTVSNFPEEKAERMVIMLKNLSRLNVQRGYSSSKELYAYFDEVVHANAAASLASQITTCITRVRGGRFDIKHLVKKYNNSNKSSL